MKPIDIILITCNRIERTSVTIDELYKRIKIPFRLIVIDDMSIDGTAEYLKEQKELGRVHVFEQLENSNICQAYNKGFQFVESDYFITMQDDITPPDLEPDVIQQLIDLIEKYPNHAGIGCRIQHIPNMNWQEGDLTPARKSLSAYFRIQRKKDFEGREFPFGNRDWDDRAFVSMMREERGMECSWANNLWVDHSRGHCQDRGYLVKPRKWGMGIHSRTREGVKEKEYPVIDPKTCVSLEILNADKVQSKELNPDQNFFGFKMRTRKKYYDERILMSELNPERDIYRIPLAPKIVVDVGAHIGGTSLLCAKRGATVFAFEPELSNFNTLRYNVRRNRLHDKVHCFNFGIGIPGRYELMIHNRNSGANSAYGFHAGSDVIAKQIVVFKSLHEVFKDLEIEHCDLLKMDCEGGEEDIILEFDDEIADKIDQISMELHRGNKRLSFIDILSKWYDCEQITKYEWVCRKKI